MRSIADGRTCAREALCLKRPPRVPLTVPVDPGTLPDAMMTEYRPDLYHLGQADVTPEPGQVATTRDGKRKVTRDGGVWAVDAKERYREAEDVLRVDCSRFPVEPLDGHMLAEMAALVARVPTWSLPVPLHYGTLVTRATIEFGWEPLLMAAALDPQRFGEILDCFGAASLTVAEGRAQTEGVELVIIHDDIAGTRGPILSPAFLRQHVYPWFERLFDAIHRHGRKVLYLSDGNTLPILDDLLALGPDGLYVESSSVDPREFLSRAGRAKIFLIKTSSQVMDFGTPEEIRREVRGLSALWRDYPGIFLYAGGGNPPPENRAAFREAYWQLLATTG